MILEETRMLEMLGAETCVSASSGKGELRSLNKKIRTSNWSIINSFGEENMDDDDDDDDKMTVRGTMVYSDVSKGKVREALL